MNLKDEIAKEAVRRATAMGVFNAGMYEAARIAVQLVEDGWTPTDPDLVEAREMAAQDAERTGVQWIAKDYRAGLRDDATVVKRLREGIRRGRELERGRP